MSLKKTPGTVKLRTVKGVQLESVCLAVPFGTGPAHLTRAQPINLKFVRGISLKAEDWKRLETSLGRTLPSMARSALKEALSWFFFTVIYRDKLLPPHRYVKQMLDRISIAQESLESLEDALTPLFNKSVAVTHAQDHFSALVAAKLGEPETYLDGLRRELDRLEREYTMFQRTGRGRDGHFQLDTLYINFVSVAKAAGAKVTINSHDDRYSKDFRPTQLVAFVATAFGIALEASKKVLDEYSVSGRAREEIDAYLLTLLKKSPGNLISPLEQVLKMQRATAGNSGKIAAN